MQTPRLYFIDAVRAFAILMMLQGHFIDTLLAPEYKDLNNTAFQVWSYFRGITAPTFFTISGLIFTYLLLIAKRKGTVASRMKKGLWRGLMLIGIGYALRIPLYRWLNLEMGLSFFKVDVLQIIGLSLIIVVLMYQLLLRKTFIFSILMFLIGTAVFLCEPMYRNLELPNIPIPLSNYLSKSNGSIFTLIPWFGYMAYGAFIATIFYKYLAKHHFKTNTIIGFILTGIILIYFSSHILMLLHFSLDVELFKEVAYYNYLFTRLGNVLILFALFYLFEFLVRQPLILRIGQKTLSIYVIHFIIIYGSFTGLGLNQIIGPTLNPNMAIIGAIVFLIVVCFLSFYYMKPNKFIYQQIRKFLDNRKNNKAVLD
ncbi:heparan-alpha-glucosaminide N-acetyltransferase domain-containing protein [Winogradskyella aurantiaca]|uniref:heparan-alpha-glucosaminide N-acetyltransferase domain-containing protein n=1 Tax=Winogradskyella aurantiaca TaxID=2219558 RepID=UPI000E1E1A95|nr:heparan-alpha-glucosaminide N-acetyltransferase domain-containing protein [Winogradskyella aurantiaca]